MLNGAVWTDGAVVSQSTRQMPFKENFIPTNYMEQNVVDGPLTQAER